MKTGALVVPVLITVILIAVWMFTEKPRESKELGHSHHDVKLAVYMGQMQVFADKLWWAGKAGNEELVNFYLRELKQVMEEAQHHAKLDELKEIGPLMDTYGLNGIERLENGSLEDEEFEVNYEVLVQSCNGCHIETKYPFIKITVPQKRSFSNQDMTP